MRVRRFAFLIFLVACWLWPAITWAQSATTGAIAGVVKDVLPQIQSEHHVAAEQHIVCSIRQRSGPRRF